MPLIPRLSERLDAELIRQQIGNEAFLRISTESLAVEAINELADQIEQAGWPHPARWLRAEGGK
jgi:hypothetical protein